MLLLGSGVKFSFHIQQPAYIDHLVWYSSPCDYLRYINDDDDDLYDNNPLSYSERRILEERHFSQIMQLNASYRQRVCYLRA